MIDLKNNPHLYANWYRMPTDDVAAELTPLNR